MQTLLQSFLTFAVCFIPGVLCGLAIAAIHHNRRITTRHRNQLRYGIRK
jgi:hypothetical protein